MARPIKQGLDYFPFDVNFFTDIKVRRLSKACGPTSQSILICLLCTIYQDKGYYIEWNKDLPFIIADSIGVSEGAVEEVVKKAIQVGLFDETMYEKYSVITSTGVQSRYFEVTERRKKTDFISEYILIDFVNDGVNDNINGVNVYNNSVNVCRSTQRKVKESKVNKKENKKNEMDENAKRFTPPLLENVKIYISEKEYSVDAESFVAFYQSKNWFVGKNKMKDWQASVLTWHKRNSGNQSSKNVNDEWK